jgi:outer membrane protein
VERAQASIQKEQNDLAELADRLQNEFALEQARINDEARDSIQSFLKRYNKTKKFDYVLVKAGDNLLIANPKYNITNDIVKGLNKRYKIKPEVAEQIKASKEEND